MNPKTNTKATATTISNPTSAAAAAPVVTTTNGTAGLAPTLQATQAPHGTLVTSVANGNNTGTKVELQSSYVALITGLQATYRPGDVLYLSTGTQTCQELVTDLQRFVQAAEATKTANKVWRGNVQTERQIESETAPVRAAVKSLLESRFGKGAMQMASFGFVPHKPSKRSAVSKVTALVKSTATRKARGTRGSKQKLAIRGDVTGVVITPVTPSTTAPTTPEPATAPVAPAPAAKPTAAS